MLPEQIVSAARRLRRRGKTCREVAAALRGQISKSSVQRKAPGRHRRSVRCLTCGGMVEPPCRLCRQRAARHARHTQFQKSPAQENGRKDAA